MADGPLQPKGGLKKSSEIEGGEKSYRTGWEGS